MDCVTSRRTIGSLAGIGHSADVLFRLLEFCFYCCNLRPHFLVMKQSLITWFILSRLPKCF